VETSVAAGSLLPAASEWPDVHGHDTANSNGNGSISSGGDNSSNGSVSDCVVEGVSGRSNVSGGCGISSGRDSSTGGGSSRKNAGIQLRNTVIILPRIVTRLHPVHEPQQDHVYDDLVAWDVDFVIQMLQKFLRVSSAKTVPSLEEYRILPDKVPMPENAELQGSL